MTNLLWRLLAGTCVALGALGVLLPGLPTTPFLLVAAWAGAKGWPELEARLLAHPKHGPVIRDWREKGAVPRRAKWLASVFLLTSIALLWLAPLPAPVRWLVPPFLVGVGAWLWLRPEA